MAVKNFGWGRPRAYVAPELGVAVPTITSYESVVRVGDPDWCETWYEWYTWSIAGLRPSRRARFGIKMSSIADNFIGGGPFLDTGMFKVEIKGTVVGEKTLSRLAPFYINIPANLINPDGTTWVRVYGTPHNFYIHGIEVSIEQP